MSKLFLSMVGSIFEREDVTSAFRLIDAAVAGGFDITVWACGGATLLTQKQLGRARPRNFLELGTIRTDIDYPTTAVFAAALLSRADGHLHWCVCRHCMEERGAYDHIDGVDITPPFRYVRKIREADVALTIGQW